MEKQAVHLSPDHPRVNGTGQDGNIEQPLPHFYIVRPDKSYVPLIAADEIDPMWCIKGVPATLSADLIQQWNMARCGDGVDRQKYKFQIEQLYVEGSDEESYETSFGTEASPTASELSGQNGGGQRAKQGYADGEYRKSTASARQTQEAIDQMILENTWAKNNDHSRTKDAATPGIFGKKRYCTYWIRTGNCDYIQEGCRYLHVIPDEETRLKIGIRDMPRWAKEDLPTPQHGPDRKYHQRSSLNQDWRNSAAIHAPAEISKAPRAPENHSRLSPTVLTPPSSINVQNSRFPSPPNNPAAAASQLQKHHHTSYTHQPNRSSRPMQNHPTSKHFKSDGFAAAASYQRQLAANTNAGQAGRSDNLAKSSVPDTGVKSPQSQPPIGRPATNTSELTIKEDQTDEDSNIAKFAPDRRPRFSIFDEAHSHSSSPATPVQFPIINHFPETMRFNKTPSDARVQRSDTPTTAPVRPNHARVNHLGPRHHQNPSVNSNGTASTNEAAITKGKGAHKGTALIQDPAQTKGTNDGPVYYHTLPETGAMAHLRRFVAPGSPVYVVNSEESEKPVKQPAKPNGHRHNGNKTTGRGKRSHDVIGTK